MFTSMGMIIALLGRIVIGTTLLVAGMGKVQNGQSKFLQSILGYDLVPQAVAAFMANWLPWLELMVGAMLLAGLFSQVASITAFGLFLIFTGAITLSLLRGMDNDCGCFRHVTPVQWRLVFRDVLLMGLLLPVFGFKGGILTIEKWLPIQTGMSTKTSTLVMNILVSIWGFVFIAEVLLHRFMQKRTVPDKTTAI